MVRKPVISLCCALTAFTAPCLSAHDLLVGDVVLKVGENGRSVSTTMASESLRETVSSESPFCVLQTQTDYVLPEDISLTDDHLDIKFADGSSARFNVSSKESFSIFRCSSLDLKSSVSALRLPLIPVHSNSRLNGTLNAAFKNGQAISVVSASTDIIPYNSGSGSRTADLNGCSHSFTRETEAKEGSYSAEFLSTCSLATSGWSMQGNGKRYKLARDSVTGLKAWIYGDGKGQQLKFQLIDEGGGATDYYVPVNFVGWREITMTEPAYHVVKGHNVGGLNLYYNGVPQNTTVRCLVDDIRALVNSGQTTTSVQLEDFEQLESPWWNDGTRKLGLEWDLRFSGVGDAFGIIACSEDDYFHVMKRFEQAAGILTPYPGGVWNKVTPAVNDSYLFLTSFSESEFDEALALAQRGGFKHVLLEQHSWCKSTGHYEINEQNFSGGLKSLVRTLERFRENGIKVGLHLLSASIDSNDAYFSPKPDSRLLKDAQTTLVATLDNETTTIVVESMPEKFPAEDGGYYGDGTVLQIGSELIKYTARSTTVPFTFYNCARGHLGTHPESHSAGEQVLHLARSYGYHMMDMDSSLLEEVASNFAKVANACKIDMVYFDGSERLQGEHQQYNPRLINAFLSKLDQKDILVQASSFTHFSWHQLARTASADGHGDLKGYLEERSPGFKTFRETGLPIDIGWYYGYDTSATPDMYEYILGTTIGYDASFSFQVSVEAAKSHPFTAAILDLIKRYEKLRQSGRVTTSIKELLKVHPGLQGRSPEDTTRDNSLRRDYRLAKENGADVFQRVIYGDWHKGDSASNVTQWTIDVTTAPVFVGIQLQVLPGDGGQTIENPAVEINGQNIGWQGSVKTGEYVDLLPNEPARLFSPAFKSNEGAVVAPLSLQQGTHSVKFTCETGAGVPYRVRVNLHCPEKHVIP